jgi:serine/threonine-protein kinase
MKLCPKCLKQFSDDANFCPVDAARLSPLPAPVSAPVSGLDGQATAADSIAGRFELGARLGGGRTGAVHRAIDRTTGHAAAVKIVAPAVVALPGLAPRLERELKQLERVQSAGVAKVLASGKRGDDSWVALELLDGAQTLAGAIAARGPIPLDQAAHLIEVVGEALIEAAQVGVVHRDLAPKNILFAGAEVRLINFSLPVPTPTNDKVPGVPEFVAPEQHEGKPVDQRSNLYSLGALYYFVLTGQTVQLDDGGAVKPPSTVISSGISSVSDGGSGGGSDGIPAVVEAVILRALDRSPTKRFLTVRQFIDEVGRIARGEVEPKITQPLGRAGKPKAELVQTLLGVRGGGLAAAATGGPAMPAPLPPQVLPSERSPWAPPPSVGPKAQGLAQVAPPEVSDPAVPAQIVTAPVAAAPVVAPAAPAAPVVAPAAPAAPILGTSSKKPTPGGDSKGKFRDTMWFKKGELDAEAAEAAAQERARTGKTGGHDKADSLPIDERYKDDGSLSRTDKQKYSLRTGGTMAIGALRDAGAGASADKVSEDALIGEMKSGRTMIMAFIAIGIVAVALIVFLIVR